MDILGAEVYAEIKPSSKYFLEKCGVNFGDWKIFEYYETVQEIARTSLQRRHSEAWKHLKVDSDARLHSSYLEGIRMDFLTNSDFSVQIIQAMRCAQINERIFFHGIWRSFYSVHGSSLEGTSTAKSRQQILY